jgi:hypothetical protein
MSTIMQMLMGQLPEPTIKLYWGKNISPENMEKLKAGETAILYERGGIPDQFIVWSEELLEIRCSPYNEEGINSC